MFVYCLFFVMIITNDPETRVLLGGTYLKVLPSNKFDKKKSVNCFILLNAYPSCNRILKVFDFVG